VPNVKGSASIPIEALHAVREQLTAIGVDPKTNQLATLITLWSKQTRATETAPSESTKPSTMDKSYC